ncbi:protein rolling stone-like [Saccoglossus kowalevskii]|uniref:Protein rolling stone-like n=1 Tax=Saccoglossus kowalevskii TaxID=10224 RepID=A0ABM0GKI5_SACKO|nr:PREDICTED: protein rolling stone-like [Saccoglossus kowalevskii]
MCGGEFRPSNFGHSGVRSVPEFTTSQWRWLGLPGTYLFYRLCIFLYQLIWNILCIVNYGPPYYSNERPTYVFFVYASHWGYCMLTLYFFTALVSAVVYHAYGKKDTAIDHIEMAERGASSNDVSETLRLPLPWYMRLNWFIQNIAFASGLTIVLLFWAIDYDPATAKIHPFNVHVHGVNAFLILFDLFVIASPIRVLHVIYPMIFLALYGFFTYIYYACGGLNPEGEVYLYKIVNWKTNPGMAVGAFGGMMFVLIPLAHFLLYGLYRLRLCISDSIHRRSGGDKLA